MLFIETPEFCVDLGEDSDIENIGIDSDDDNASDDLDALIAIILR